MAGETTASTRITISEPKPGISAHSPRKKAYHSMDRLSKRRRSQPATTLANSGAPMAITSAAAVINCPATGTVMASEVLMSLSVPGTTMTPVPMTKLPNSKGQRTLGSASGAVCSVMAMLGGVIVPVFMHKISPQRPSGKRE